MSEDSAFVADGRGFSCPQERLDKELFGEISVMYAQGALELFLERAAKRLEECGSGAADLLRSWVMSDATLAESWSPLFGEALDSLKSPGRAAAEEIAIALLFHLHACGLEGEWELAAAEEVSVRCDGHVLAPARRYRVSAETEAVSVETDSKTVASYTFYRDGSGWRCPEARRSAVVEAPGGGTIVLLSRGDLLSIEIGDLQTEVRPEIPESDLDRCRNALSLLATHAPEYVDWVEFVLREIAMLTPKAEMVHSGGVGSHFGQIHMSSTPSRTLMAEMLVHEAAHQYFELLRRMDPLETTPETRQHYSPVVGRERPLWAVLKAFHAFANIQLLHTALRAAGVPESDFTIVNLAQVRADLDSLHQTLLEHGDLTPLGRDVFAPLSERIEAL